MVLLLLGIGILTLIAGAILDHLCYRQNAESASMLCYILGGITVFICVVVITGLAIVVTQSQVCEDKIIIYEEENAEIEQQIEVLVKSYMEYENTIFTECSSKSSIQLVSLYPELKSDILVQKQIETYVTNNAEIKTLKSNLLYAPICRWWLYFGGE